MKKLKSLLAVSLSALTCISLVAGCASNNKNSTATNGMTSSPVHIKWYAVCSPGPQANVSSVEKAVGDYLRKKNKLNIDLELVLSTFNDYSTKMPVVISSGENYDLCWTSSWNNNYYSNVNKSAFVPLDNLLTKDAPELYKSIDKSIWDGTRIKKKIYGVPSIQIMCKQNYVVVAKEYLDKYNFDISKVKTLSDLDGFFHQVKKDNPSVYPFAVSSNGLQGKLNLAIGYEEIAGVKIPGAFKFGDKSLTVVNQYEMDPMKNFYTLMHKWSKDGIIRQDASTVENNAIADLKSGKSIATVNATYKPGIEATDSANFGGKEVKYAMLSEPYEATSSIVSSLNSISVSSKNPDTAMKFLNLVNTDAKLYNLLCFGEEDTNYTKNSDDTVTENQKSGYYLNAADWVFGNQFNAYLRKGQDSKIWEQTKKLNKEATQSPALGFSFDSTSVTNEIAAVSKVTDQYVLALDSGAADPSVKLPEMITKLKAAGSDTIIREMQKQVNSWKSSKK